MTRTTRNLIAGTAILPLLVGLSGCGTTGITQAARMVDNARKVQQTAQTVEQVTGQDMGVVADPLGTQARAEAAAAAEMEASALALDTAAPISAAPMAVEMRKDTGRRSVMTMRPRVAVVGYNIAALTEGKITGTARGGLFGSSMGASSTTELTSTGIDAALVERVADAAAADLVAQLTAAGFDVIAPAGVAASPQNEVMRAGEAAVERRIMTGDGARKRAIVAGPTDYGFRQVNSGIAERGLGSMRNFGGNAPGRLSTDLDAVLVQPSLTLDFATFDASRTIGRRASSEAELAFGIDPSSRIDVHASNERGGVFWLAYNSRNGAQSDAVFARMGETDSRENALEQGLGAALGMGVRAKKTTEATVHIDPERYEALALSAARGWNAAFVQQAIEARNRES